MYLGKLIEILKAEDQNKVCRFGFNNPHSWRGVYAELAFEPAENVSVAEMLSCAEYAVGTTCVGYKGGYFTMNEWTEVHISNYGDSHDFLPEFGLRFILDTQP